MQNFKFEITPEMVYGKDYKVPDGWEAIGFDIPSRGEDWLRTGSPSIVANCTPSNALPRLIVRKKQPRRIVLEECSYEEADQHYQYKDMRLGFRAGKVENWASHCADVTWLRIVEAPNA